MPTTRHPGHADCSTCECGAYPGDHCKHEHEPWITDGKRSGDWPC